MSYGYKTFNADFTEMDNRKDTDGGLNIRGGKIEEVDEFC